MPLAASARLLMVKAVGPVAGAHLDPSHFFFQDIDPFSVVRLLDDFIYYVHANDSQVDRHNAGLNTTLDPKPMTDAKNRSWLYCTIDYGHGEIFWRDFFNTLRMVGYDDIVSIEHEDQVIDPEEGFANAVRFLNVVLIKTPAAKLRDA